MQPKLAWGSGQKFEWGVRQLNCDFWPSVIQLTLFRLSLTSLLTHSGLNFLVLMTVNLWPLNFQNAWIHKFGSWNRLTLFKSPWLGHLKVYFHTKETSSQILYCLSYSFLELKGENEQIWLQTLFRTVSQLSCNIDPTQSIISTQTSIIIRTPRFFRSPKPTETYTWDEC